MPYTANGKDLMLAALAGTNPAAPITHAGLLNAEAGKAVTIEADDDTVTSNGHGYANGDLVVFTALNGGAGLVVGRPYFVINTAANTFKVALKPGGAAVDVTTDAAAVSTVQRLVELAGGAPAYARKAIAFNAPANGTMDDSTNGAVFDVPAGAEVDFVGFYSAAAAGTVQAIDDVTPEVFAGQGTYTLTDADLDLLTGV